MPKKNQTPVFLKVYKDKAGVETFKQFEMERQEDGKYALLPNSIALNEDGTPKIRAMNRAARRLTPEDRELRKRLRQ